MNRLVSPASSVSFAVFVIATIATLCAPARAAMLHLRVDPKSSKITVTVAKPIERLQGDVTATFTIARGEVDGDPLNPATAHVHLVIDATSFDSGFDHRDRKVLHSSLQTYDYQTITFDSTRIEDVEVESPGGVGKATVVGNLTLHGTTREVRVPMNVSFSPEHQLYADGAVTLTYTDFGVTVPRIFGTLAASDKAALSFHIVAMPPAPPSTPGAS
ncbi:MAG: YceI family protein [Candidatus Binataceae bacterium]